jgi:hypothetical protein
MGALCAIRCDMVLSIQMTNFYDFLCNYCTIEGFPVMQVSICNLVHSLVMNLIGSSQQHVESPLGMTKVVLWCTTCRYYLRVSGDHLSISDSLTESLQLSGVRATEIETNITITRNCSHKVSAGGSRPYQIQIHSALSR